MSNPDAPSYVDRDVRQRELLPPQRLSKCHAVVVGVGAIGRQAAVQLAAAGVPAMDLIDHDVVAVENLAVQGYGPADLGLAKVEATVAACRRLNPDLRVGAHAHRFRRSSVNELAALKDERPSVDPVLDPVLERVLFCCVDDVSARRLVWEATRQRLAFFADGRMAAEVLRVLVSTDPPADAYYASTLFSPERAYAGSCTARSTIYSACIAAGLMVGAFARWLRGLPVERDLVLNLLAAELTIA
jgi:sulfur carrier protein ThiS adenylyltransferase